MAEEVVLKLSVDAVGAAQSVKELKQIIRDANNEALKFDQGSAEFAKFANIAAKAKDKVQDFREQMNLLDPDAKIRAFTGVGNAIVGGFTAGIGAAQLFGASAEDAQKALLKVQSAMALLQGFQAIQEGAKSFKLLKATVLEVVNSAGLLKTALISTGIGAVAVIIGTLAGNWQKFKEAIEISFPAFDKVGKWWQKFKEVSFGTLASIVAGFKQVGTIINDVVQFQFGKAVADAQQFPKALGDAYDKAVEIYNRPDLPEAIENAATKPIKAARDEAKMLKEDIDWIFGNAIEAHIEYNEKSDELRMRNVEGAKQALADRIEAEKTGSEQLLDILATDAEFRKKVEADVFNVVANIGKIFFKNQKKAAEFSRKLGIIKILGDQAEALAGGIKGAMGLPFPGNVAAAIGTIATITAMFANIKNLFSKAGGDVAAPTNELASGGISASSFSTGTSGVNFLNQPQTTLPSNNPEKQSSTIDFRPTIVISESEITNVQKNVKSLEAQATIG